MNSYVFQFQNGTIKAPDDPLKNMQPLLFQFQNGTIKARRRR